MTMQVMLNNKHTTGLIIRITAMWAFSEAFLGGILHGLKIPFTGLLLSCIASVCITLIASATVKKGEILKATLLVIAIKFILSPHTPPMAYLAVMIQGLAGELLFLNRRMIKPAAFLLTLFSEMYSAFQHLFVLTVLFGKNLWTALDIFLNKITETFIPGSHQYSLYLILIYISCYFLAGIVGGILNVRIIHAVQSEENSEYLVKVLNEIRVIEDETMINTGIKKKKILPFVLGGIFFTILLISYFPFFELTLLKHKAVEIILRGLIIVIAWNYFFTPLLKKWMYKWFDRYKTKKANDLQQIISLIPVVKTIVLKSWQISGDAGKWRHIKNFINNSILLIVYYEKKNFDINR